MELKEWIMLSMAKGVGPVAMRKLLDEFGAPAAARRASAATLEKIVPKETARNIKNPPPAHEKTAAAAGEWARRDGCYIITLNDKRYPFALQNIPNPPMTLYVRGAPQALLERPLIAVVGSRSASPAGVNNTEIFARSLCESGVNIVSGLAEGIDAAAHRGALLGKGKTVAVFGTGIDIIYPKHNRTLAMDIVNQGGALISDFPLGTPPLKENFPSRNRIISGLAKGCLVMEATKKSGSLVTALLAAEQGREVFAVPGSINAPLHRGCHKLIKEGAKLAENINDILEELNLTPRVRELLPPPPEAGELLGFVDFEPTALDAIAERSGLAASDLLADLLALEMEGKIVSAPGGGYQRV